MQVLSRCSRSQGRALKRYGFAVNAPTGQICTVLPEKYEENGKKYVKVDQKATTHRGELSAFGTSVAQLPSKA